MIESQNSEWLVSQQIYLSSYLRCLKNTNFRKTELSFSYSLPLLAASLPSPIGSHVNRMFQIKAYKTCSRSV